jgi:hypothetical protein
VRFFYHYNKPLSKQRGYPVISLHYSGQCHFLKGIRVEVPTWSKFNKRQPYYVMQGECERVKIARGIATVE